MSIEAPVQSTMTPAVISPEHRSAMGHFPSHVRLWIVTGAGLALDLWSKDWAFKNLRWDPPRTIIKDLCSFQLSLNPGALFGLGEGAAPIFVGASVLALMFVLYLFANSSRSRAWMHIALGMVLAGALGNLYDRTTQSAFVARFPDGTRDIGVLIDRGQTTVTLGEFPGGGHPRTHYQKLEARSGPQPVVRDFIKINARIGKIEIYPWIFNVADALLVVGVAILLMHFWVDRKRHDPPSEGDVSWGPGQA
jgi:lipoprotein signal peptidase